MGEISQKNNFWACGEIFPQVFLHFEAVEGILPGPNTTHSIADSKPRKNRRKMGRFRPEEHEKTEEEKAEEEEQELNKRARTAYDLQRSRLEKLMKDPEKPVSIPESPLNRKPKDVNKAGFLLQRDGIVGRRWIW